MDCYIDFCAVGLISETARPLREVSARWCRFGHRLLPVGQFTDLPFESLDRMDYIGQAHLAEPHRHAVVAAGIHGKSQTPSLQVFDPLEAKPHDPGALVMRARLHKPAP